jgi:hypothetical protein
MSAAIFNPLDHPICLEFPKWLDETAWAEHLPFAMYIMSAARPETFVELGSYRGVSYCGFCQAVRTLELRTNCYAVDTWKGDSHAGTLDDAVFEKLKSYHDSLYGHFSTLLRSTFEEALKRFPDNSIDLLHIDGFHTYDAVRKDFEDWLPKMSARGIILFHDISERQADFGVWKLWSELTSRYPSFAFEHGHGLGVLAVGESMPIETETLFNADAETDGLIRRFFEELGTRIEAVRAFKEQQQTIESLRAHERAFHHSRVLRTYRKFKEQGIRSFLTNG